MSRFGGFKEYQSSMHEEMEEEIEEFYQGPYLKPVLGSKGTHRKGQTTAREKGAGGRREARIEAAI